MSARSWMPSEASRPRSSGTRRAARCACSSPPRIRERTRALVLYGSYAKRRDPDDDYPWAPTAEERLAYARSLEETWGENVDISTMSPNADEALQTWYQRRGRASLSPAAARDLILMNSKADVRRRAARGAVPDARPPPQWRPRLASRGGAVHRRRGSPAPASSSCPATTTCRRSRPDEIVDEIEEFLTGVRPVRLVRPGARHGPLHRSRRLDGEGGRYGRRGVGIGSSRRTRRRARRARPLLGGGDRHCRRRLPRALRRACAGDPLWPRRSGTRSPPSGSTCARGCTRGRSSGHRTRSRVASRSTSGRGSCRSRVRARSWSARRPVTSWKAPASSSRTAASTS